MLNKGQESAKSGLEEGVMEAVATQGNKWRREEGKTKLTVRKCNSTTRKDAQENMGREVVKVLHKKRKCGM